MRRQHQTIGIYGRLLSLFLVIALLTVPAGAADIPFSFQEPLPPVPVEISPQWTETDVTCVSGNNTLQGTLTCPKEHADRIPVAILLHGLNTDRHWCDDIAWFLADHGIASVRFDFDGNGLSDGAQEDMTIASLTEDTLAILDYTESLDFADPDHIFLVGKSIGAVAAVLAAEQRPGEIASMCLWYPGFGAFVTAKLGMFLGQMFKFWDPPETMEIAGFTYGRAFLEELVSMDVQNAIRQYQSAVLIIQGDRDIVAPVFFGAEAARLFPDCTFHVVPGGMHGFNLEQELYALHDMLTFFTSQESR